MTERFEIQSQLGKGGMGVVWKARDSETGEIIALKLLHSLYVDDPDYVARFEREVEVSQRIVSPNVVRVLGYGKRDGVPYVAMEYVDGKSLREVVHERGPLPWDEAKPILRQIAEGLGAAHAAGVIHRDVKPSNIMIDSAGTVKLADFGIARAMDLTRMTGGVTMLGTPAYMSPDMETTEQSDLYGLGCVLFELLTGAPPFPADSQQQALMRHLRDAPKLENLPPGARKITGWLLEKDPRRRPASAAALLGVLDGSSKIVRSGVGGSSSRWKPGLVVAGSALIAVVALVVGATFVDRGSSASGAIDAPASGPRTITAAPVQALYGVSSGDTCGGIASKFSLTIADLLVENGVGETWCESFRVGQAIRIPTPGRASWLGTVGSTVEGVTLNLDIRKGDLVKAVATGSWCLGQQQAAERVCYDAFGEVPAPWDTDLLFRSGRIGALIARTGSGPWESAAEGGRLEFTAKADGLLELWCNDRESYYDDNYGYLRVAIVVMRPGG